MKVIISSLAVLCSAFTVIAAPVFEADEHSAAVWDFSKAVKNTIQDKSGYANHITLDSKEKAALPKITADGMLLDGKGGYGRVKVGNSLRIGKGDFAIEIAFRIRTMTVPGVNFYMINNKPFSNIDSGFGVGGSTWQQNYFFFMYALNKKAVVFKLPLGKRKLDPTRFYTLTISRKGNTLSGYLDKELLAETKVSGDINLYHRTQMNVGIYCTPWQRDKQKRLILNAFDGTISSIRISDCARKPGDVSRTAVKQVSVKKRAVRNKFVGVYSWSKNADSAAKILNDLKAVGEKAELVGETGDFSKYDVLFIPKAELTPLSMQDTLPKFLAKGGHVIFESWPEKTFAHGEVSIAWEEPLPGMAHCVVDSRWTYPGFSKGRPASLYLKGSGSELDLKNITGVRSLNGRSINKCQWRLTTSLGTGRVDYHDCIDLMPLAICDGKGKVLAQHTAGVRHYCSFFPRATILCADFQKDPKLKLLYGPQGKKYLAFLLKTVRGKVEDEPEEDYLQNSLALRKAVTALKLKYNEAVYLTKDLHFHTDNNTLCGKKSADNFSKRFTALEKESLNLFAQFAKYRFNRMAFAVRYKENLLKEINDELKKIDSYLAQGQKQLKTLLAANKGKRFTVPEKGEINIMMSFADFSPLSWGGSPGYIEYANGRTIASLGLDGTCHNNNYSGYPMAKVTPQLRKYSEDFKEVFYKYRKETGLKKFTGHAYGSTVVPRSIVEKYNKNDGAYLPDFAKETMPKARNFNKAYYAFLSGVGGIISSAAESPEMKDYVELIIKRAANMEGIHTHSIVSEGVMVGGYSEYGFHKYREFLKKRHGSIENLNKVWGSSYKSFDEIKPLCKFHKTRTEYCNNFDWVEFRTQEYLKYYKKLTETYRKYDKKHRLTACVNQISPLQGLEFYEFCKYFDFAGSHNTPTSAAWYQANLIRRGQRADNNEPKWISFYAPWNLSGAEDELQKCQRYKMLYFAFQGMSEFAPYEWRHGTSARFADMDGTLYLAGAEFKEFTRWKNKWQNLMGAVSPKDHAATGLYWSYVTKSQGRGGPHDGSIDKSLFSRYFRLMDSWNHVLDQAQIPYVTVARGRMRENDMQGIKTLIVPQASYLEPDIMEKMLKFAENGGELILEGQVGRYDQYHREDNRIFDSLGLVQLPAAGNTLADKTNVTPLLTMEEVGPAYLTFESIDPAGTKVLYRYKDSTPAAVRVKYGKGSVICTGFSVTDITPHAIAKKLLATSLKNRLASSDAQGVMLFPWQGKNGYLYVGVLNFSGDWRSVPVKFAGKVAEAYDFESGVTMNRKKNTVVVPLFPAGARIVAVKLK